METFSRLDSVLLLSSVNLPGGELVNKSTSGSVADLLLCLISLSNIQNH